MSIELIKFLQEQSKEDLVQKCFSLQQDYNWAIDRYHKAIEYNQTLREENYYNKKTVDKIILSLFKSIDRHYDTDNAYDAMEDARIYLEDEGLLDAD